MWRVPQRAWWSAIHPRLRARKDLTTSSLSKGNVVRTESADETNEDMAQYLSCSTLFVVETIE